MEVYFAGLGHVVDLADNVLHRRDVDLAELARCRLLRFGFLGFRRLASLFSLSCLLGFSLGLLSRLPLLLSASRFFATLLFKFANLFQTAEPFVGGCAQHAWRIMQRL